MVESVGRRHSVLIFRQNMHILYFLYQFVECIYIWVQVFQNDVEYLMLIFFSPKLYCPLLDLLTHGMHNRSTWLQDKWSDFFLCLKNKFKLTVFYILKKINLIFVLQEMYFCTFLLTIFGPQPRLWKWLVFTGTSLYNNLKKLRLFVNICLDIKNP